MISPLFETLLNFLRLKSFSIALICGAFVYLYLMQRLAVKKHILTADQCTSYFFEATIVAILSARLMHVISEWHTYTSLVEMLSLWNGGLSMIGAVIGAVFYVSIRSWYNSLPLLKLLDCAAVYAPLFHAIGRIGCFFHGCCFGIASSAWWAITYTHHLCAAPLNESVHPTQLYSAAVFIVIALVLQLVYTRWNRIQGLTTCVYIIAMCVERFTIDFWRGDRLPGAYGISVQQYTVAICGILACIALGVCILHSKTGKSKP